MTFWGTRGSIPTPSTSSFVTTRYGGDTTCIAVDAAGHRIILDGGSGLRLLGLEMARQTGPWHATFFFSHLHWDHIQGFPFFKPAFCSGNRFELYGPHLPTNDDRIGSVLEQALRGQQSDLNFPVQLNDMPSEMIFRDLSTRAEVVIPTATGSIRVFTAPLNHPGGCFGYRIEEHIAGQPPRTLVFATDTEHLKEPNPELQFLARGADVMIYDCQYTPEEYDGTDGPDHRGWGHSTYEWALREARCAGVKKVLMHHHDPLHDDSKVEEIETRAQEAATGSGIKIHAATQNLTLEI